MVCLMLGFCLAACKEKIQKAKVETIEGVAYIHNPATPLSPTRAIILEEFTYKDTDESGETRLFKPGGFAVDAKGNVLIKDESDMAIKVFDQAGNFLRPIGRRGEGPGEFTSMGYIFPLPDGRLLVTDPLARRTSFFSPEGQFLSSFAWKKLFQRIYLVSDSSCTLEEGVYAEDSRGLWIKMIDFSGEELIAFGKFNLPELKTFREEGGATLLPIPWSPASVFAGDQTRQWLYHCPSDKYEIEVYDRQGNLIRKIDRPYEFVPVTSDDIRKFRSRFADKPESPLVRYYQQMEFPKVKSITNRMIVDSEGNLWVRTNEMKKEGGKEIAAYDIFTPEGFYEARVWLDVIPAVFAGGKMYLMDEDETTGMRRVKRYRVVWKEN
ncbi:MAG: 6-bladed beta-propeller [Candidatus Aminicenantales bacterium]